MSAEAHEHAHAAHQAAQEGVKEVANWVTLLTHGAHDKPWAHFLHTWENVIFSWTVAAFLILIGLIASRKMDKVPSGLQNFLESLVEGLETFVVDVLGERGKKYVPFIGTLFLYIFGQNIIGIIPFLKAPTSSVNTTAGLAICVFLYVQFTGIKENGIFGYIHHLMGSPNDLVGWLMVPLNLPLHVMGEFIKPLSLSLRLFGNILGEDALIAAFVTLGIAATSFAHLPFGLPFQFPFMMLACITSLIQALVFSLLSTIYISLMLPHDDHGHEHGHGGHEAAAGNLQHH